MQDFNNWDPRETSHSALSGSFRRDTGNYKTFPPKRDGHDAVFTNSRQSLKETINTAGWVILLEEIFCLNYSSNWSFLIHGRNWYKG